MGQFWVEWDLPADRDVDTFWRHSVGPSVVHSAARRNVEVRSSFASKHTCCHNKYGIFGSSEVGGAFPSAAAGWCDTIHPNDVCMVVAVMSPGSSADGFTQRQNSPVFDAPVSNTDWPNKDSWGRSDGNKPPFLSVWLR